VTGISGVSIANESVSCLDQFFMFVLVMYAFTVSACRNGTRLRRVAW
jgi:hypothetical protein